MSAIEMDAIWFEPTPRRRLDTSVPVSKLMTPFARRLELATSTRQLIAVDAGTTVREAAHLMVSRGLLQVHVRDALGGIVGVLTASNLYRWVADAALTPEPERTKARGEGHA
jgi:CBS domain-containing protein